MTHSLLDFFLSCSAETISFLFTSSLSHQQGFPISKGEFSLLFHPLAPRSMLNNSSSTLVFTFFRYFPLLFMSRLIWPFAGLYPAPFIFARWCCLPTLAVFSSTMAAPARLFSHQKRLIHPPQFFQDKSGLKDELVLRPCYPSAFPPNSLLV